LANVVGFEDDGCWAEIGRVVVNITGVACTFRSIFVGLGVG